MYPVQDYPVHTYTCSNQFTSIWQNKTQEEIGAILKNIETESPRFV